MDQFKKYFTLLVGSSAASFGVRVVLALVALYTGSATDVGDAVGQALDKDRSIATCAALINETPVPAIEEAVKSETAE